MAAGKRQAIRASAGLLTGLALMAACSATADETPAATPITTGAGAAILAQPGECYARVVIAPKFETRTERRLKVAESERIDIVPEKFETVEERVLVKPESEKIVEIVPAQYRSVTEQVMVKPAGETLVEVPATYRVEQDRELVRPAHTEWKPGHGLVEKLDDASGEVLCLIDVPAEYKTVEHRVVDVPASTRRTLVPAQYATVTRQELVKDAEVRKLVVPAEYKTVTMQRLAAPAQETRVTVPAEYQDVPVQTKIADGRAEWRPVLCETNATPPVVRSLQQALAARGFDPGPRDGRLDDSTLNAVGRFQKARGLPQGAVTVETLDALGVAPRRGH